MRSSGNLASAGDRLIILRKKLIVSSPYHATGGLIGTCALTGKLDASAFSHGGRFSPPVRDYVVADVAPGAAFKTIGKRTEGQDKLLRDVVAALKPIAVMC